MNFIQNQTFDATLDARFRAAARHSRLVRILRVAVPAAVLLAMTAVLAVSIFNPFRMLLPKLPVDIGNLVVSGTKITMENPHLAGFSQDRRPYELWAKAAIQDLANPDHVELRTLRAKVMMEDRSNVTLDARTGFFDSKQQILELKKDIFLQSSTGYEAKLSQATMDINKGQVTTDLTTVIDAGSPFPLGYNGLPDWDYTNAFGGTSGATPIVTGVVALMLDANEHLGWRDVQNILAYSAHEIGSGVDGIRLNDENNTWHYNGSDNWNGGGLHYSEDYGYGAVNAYNAVRMAEVWNLFSGPKTSANESSFRQATTAPVALLDGKQTDIRFQFDGADFIVDYVNVTIDVSHSKLDDLEISLISPDGSIGCGRACQYYGQPVW